MPVIQPANGARSASTERANELIISASRFAQSGQAKQKQRQTNNKPIATVCQYISQEGSRCRVWHNKPLSLFNKNCEQISESTHESTRWTPDENVPFHLNSVYISARSVRRHSKCLPNQNKNKNSDDKEEIYPFIVHSWREAFCKNAKRQKMCNTLSVTHRPLIGTVAWTLSSFFEFTSDSTGIWFGAPVGSPPPRRAVPPPKKSEKKRKGPDGKGACFRIYRAQKYICLVG